MTISRLFVSRSWCSFNKKKMRVSFYLMVVFVTFASSQKLPDYVIPCSRTRPDFHQCCVENGKKAIPYILKGDNALKVPSLTPFAVSQIALQPNNNLKITLSNVKIHGLDTVDLKDVVFDFEKNVIKVSLLFDHLTVLGDYEIDGRLILPLRGSGPVNITTGNSLVEYKIDFSIEQKGGKDYLKLEKDQLTLRSEEQYYHLDNLFGNKQLSDETNKVLNENFREVGNELNGPVTETIRRIVTDLIKNYITRLPIDVIFSEQ